MITDTRTLRNALALVTDNIELTTRKGDTYVVEHPKFASPLVFSMAIRDGIGSVDTRVKSGRFFQAELYITCGDSNIFTWGAQNAEEDSMIYGTFQALERMDDDASYKASKRHADNSKVILNRLINLYPTS